MGVASYFFCEIAEFLNIGGGSPTAGAASAVMAGGNAIRIAIDLKQSIGEAGRQLMEEYMNATGGPGGYVQTTANQDGIVWDPNATPDTPGFIEPGKWVYVDESGEYLYYTNETDYTLATYDLPEGCEISYRRTAMDKLKGWASNITFSDVGHFVLDIVGIVPGFGMLADAGNALWYWAEGNNKMAYYSLAAIAGGSAAGLYIKYGSAVTKMTAKMIVNGSDKLAARTNKFFGATDEVLSSADDVAKQADEVVEETAKGAAKGGASSFNRGVSEAFSNHAFARGRHADLGLSVEVMTEKSMSLIESNFALLKSGDNTLIGNINGVEKTFKAFVQNGVVMSINMFSGTSNRVTAGNIIYLGDIVW